MKRLLVTALYVMTTMAVMAQENSLLNQSFWQDAPDVNAVKAEIAKGNNPIQSNGMSMDPVALAINAQAPNESIKYLLTQPGSDVNKLTHDGRTYLHLAASRGNVEIVECLLKAGAKSNIEDSHGTTPLTFTASSGQQNTKIYDLFLANGANFKRDVNPQGANVLLLAIANDKELALTNYFITKGLSLNDADADGANAFAYAAKSANIDFLKTLIQKGAQPNASALLMAAQAGGGRRGGEGANAGATLALYQYLESLNIKPTTTSKTGENILHLLVAKQNQTENIQYFISKGVDINQTDEEGNTVLMKAATANRDTALIELLLTKVKSINQANQQGLTALSFAVRSNSAQMVSYLISKGAAINVIDKKGNNLAYYAIESYRSQGGGQGFGRMQPANPTGAGARPAQAANGQGERPNNGPQREQRANEYFAKLTILKDAGLAINAPQLNGNTLYHLAIAKNDITLLKSLQPLDIDVNAKNKEGMTVLHKAALIAKDDVILKYLLSIGANKDLGTNFKETAFDLASENETLSKNTVSINFLK